MSWGRRLSRVEELLRREIAAVIVQGELRDPRLRDVAGLSITGVRVSADLSAARVFVDVLLETVSAADAIAGLNSGAAAIRRMVALRVHLKRIPTLRFEHDVSIARGAAIERVLQELGSADDDE